VATSLEANTFEEFRYNLVDYAYGLWQRVFDVAESVKKIGNWPGPNVLVDHRFKGRDQYKAGRTIFRRECLFADVLSCSGSGLHRAD
jgi:hypothetical protein